MRVHSTGIKMWPGQLRQDTRISQERRKRLQTTRWKYNTLGKKQTL
jgi:hypothetical protein